MVILNDFSESGKEFCVKQNSFPEEALSVSGSNTV
jgi:hypothetical protein